MAHLPLVSPLDRILFLRAQPYLFGQPPEVLTALASYTEEQFYSRGTVIRPEGQGVEQILFLVEGSVEIRDRGDTESPPRQVSAPAVIGLPHHFVGAKHPPGVVAIENTLCLALDVTDLDQILEDHFSLVLRFSTRSAQEALHLSRTLGPNRLDEPGFAAESDWVTPATMDIVQRLAVARRAPLFHRTNLTVLGQLIRYEKVEIVAAGEFLWHEGDPIDRMALVLDGSFKSVFEMGSCRAPNGSVVGAWEILSDEPRAEGWVAETSSRVLPIRRELFVDLLEDHSDFALEYLRAGCSRTVASWELLAELGQNE